MKIVEKIEEMQRKLLKQVSEIDFHTGEDSIQILEKFGLDSQQALNLLIAFRNAESAKKAAKDIWKSFRENGVENENDIAKYQQNEYETRNYFDTLNAEYALLMVINRIDPNMIDEETLGELYEIGVNENQIDNQALKSIFHYYSESRAKNDQRTADIEKVKQYSATISAEMTSLKTELKETKMENEVLKAQVQEAKIKNAALLKINANWKTKFKERVESDEKYYQEARTQISILKKRLNQSQNMSVFQRLFRSKTKGLPEPTSPIPETLYENVAEKMLITGHEDSASNLNKDNRQNLETHKKENFDELQQ